MKCYVSIPERQNSRRYQITEKVLRQDLRHVLIFGIML